MDKDCPVNYTCDVKSGHCEASTEPSITVPVNCVKDQDCKKSDTICVKKLCRPKCVTDRDCSKRHVCDASSGKCTKRCKRNKQCPPNHICHRESGQCRVNAPELCVTNDNCPKMSYCDTKTRKCVPKCRQDTDCPEMGFECDVTSGKCLERLCKKDNDCKEDQFCNEKSKCQSKCVENEDCSEKFVCDRRSGKCVAANDKCVHDEDCLNERQYCDKNTSRCVDRCESARDCPEGLKCDPNTGKCALSKCANDGDCPTNQLCNKIKEECIDKCKSDSDCKSSEACNETTGICTEKNICETPKNAKISEESVLRCKSGFQMALDIGSVADHQYFAKKATGDDEVNHSRVNYAAGFPSATFDSAKVRCLENGTWVMIDSHDGEKTQTLPDCTRESDLKCSSPHSTDGGVLHPHGTWFLDRLGCDYCICNRGVADCENRCPSK